MKERSIVEIINPHERFSCWELTQMFGVYEVAIRANIKAIIKSGAVKPSFEGTLVQVGNTVLPEYYDMEMVIALAFRLDSLAAGRIRRYVVRRVADGTGNPAVPIFLCCSARSVVN